MFIITTTESYKIARYLIFQIERIDCHRYPFKIFPRNFIYALRFHPLFNKSLKKYDPNFYKELETFTPTLGRKYGKKVKGKKVVIEVIIFAIVLFYFIKFVAFYFYKILNFPLWITLIICYILFVSITMAWLFNGRKKSGNVIARAADEEIKKYAEKVISYTAEFFKEFKLDPTKFPLELRYNDYSGLKYQKFDGKFIGYLVVKNE